jgi:hypothetical protein
MDSKLGLLLKLDIPRSHLHPLVFKKKPTPFENDNQNMHLQIQKQKMYLCVYYVLLQFLMEEITSFSVQKKKTRIQGRS